MIHNRRSFISSVGSLVAAGLLSGVEAKAQEAVAGQLHVASNQYSWITFYKRKGADWLANLDASLKEFKKSNIQGYEPAVRSAEELGKLAPLLSKYQIEMRSLYVGCTLHTEKGAAESLERMIAIAKVAKPLGVKIIVTNPSPVPANRADKTDAELALQAKYLNQMGAALKSQGITLAYHTHDKEMRNAAREFHHMMLATNPEHVSLCLEAHWLYRGAGNSQLAMFDIIRLYGKRIVEVHLRQSQGGIWSETFGEGDIDYEKVARELSALKIKPHLVLEQCIENDSPNTMDAVEAHQKDLAYVSRVFGR